MVDHVQAAKEVVFALLSGAENPIWTAVQGLEVPSTKAVRPYVHYFWAGGGNARAAVNRRNARLVLAIKGVADSERTALAMKAALVDLLEDSGSQDVNPRLPAHPDWHITTVSMDRDIYLEEQFEGTQRIYHAGNQYVFMMEAK